MPPELGATEYNLLPVLVTLWLVEAIVNTLKPLWDVEKRADLGDMLAALGVGLVIAIFGGVDLFSILDIPLDKIGVAGDTPGQILTGILLSRGANFVHDLLKFVAGIPAWLTARSN